MSLHACSEPGCPTLSAKPGRCRTHARDSDRARGTRRARGYDATFDATRRDYRKRMDQGETFNCWRCGLPIVGTTFDLGHDDDDRTIIRGPEHPACNRATATHRAQPPSAGRGGGASPKGSLGVRAVGELPRSAQGSKVAIRGTRKTRTPGGVPGEQVLTLGTAGRAMWDDGHSSHELSATESVLLLEACRMKDRLDRLDQLTRKKSTKWLAVQVPDGPQLQLRVTSADTAANTAATAMKQLIAAVRFPDHLTGRRPQRRPPRGVHRPKIYSGASPRSRR